MDYIFPYIYLISFIHSTSARNVSKEPRTRHEHPSLFEKETFGHGELRRQVDVVPPQKVATQTDVLRVLGRANVASEVPLATALELHVSLQAALHLVSAAALQTLPRRRRSRSHRFLRIITACRQSVRELCKRKGTMLERFDEVAPA